ncbi:MAG: retention module-containing protein [Pseudomonadales bacterium]|nr:retention module-containing protein [Pseudomonadales bacterium]
MNPIATVVSVTGNAFARNESGELRPLKPGDVILEGEVIVTEAGGTVELDMADGSDFTVGPSAEMTMTNELLPGQEADPLQESVTEGDVAALLDALESGVDLNEVLEESAAGGGAAGEGHGFVRLARIAETLPPIEGGSDNPESA